MLGALLPPELVLSSATIYTLTFFVRRVSGNGALWAGFGSTVPFGDAYQDWFYPPEAFRECVVGQSVPFSVDIDVPALLFSSAGTNVGTIRIDAVRFESDSPVTGHRTAWLKAVVPARKTLAVDTDGSDYDIALVLWEWDGASTPTSHLTWDATPGTARIRYPVNPGTYLIEASAFDDTAGSLVLNATLDAASYGSAGLLLRGVGGAQFTSVRPSDTGGIGTMTSARPFDVVAPQLHKTSRRPFDVSGTVRQTSSRPFDLGTGGLLVLSQRPFDVIDPNQPIDPIIIVPPNPDPVNAVQQILITNHTGTFLITFMGQTTVPLAWNAAPATVQAALEDLAAISPGDVVVTAILGGFQLAFAGAYAGIPVAPVSVALAGGVTVTMRPGIHHTYYLTIRNDASQLKASQSVTVTADAEVEFYVDVLGVSDNVVDIVLDASTIEAFYIVSDKDVTMTENDDGSPDLTVALTAGVPYWWYGGFGANPFSVDLTSLKFANAGATSAHVRAAFLVSA